ncbi:TetR/AcrR family transcriptional regulator [Cryptosporangium phraense]|uniref:TetR/AcrR family transcriptional regulator n=1 Tax=Cryptosporangium phraense TaxID=2593070 RepID=A0A545AJD7_9ACTN|nr:TetR/AcrR family transcriptional regulator [Cryptosporangium phraense]TQS41446.1 TetR/AcrR family transcriptional regulator [Cryptosporangium phraense]
MFLDAPSTRRDEILTIAVDLFARRGYHGVSMDDVGAAAGVTGPALYHHFAGKEAMLAAAFTPVCKHLRDEGRRRVAKAPDAESALRSLVDFHVEFALGSPSLLRLYLHEIDRLPPDAKKSVRKLQRQYADEWVQVLVQVRPDWSPEEARAATHAIFGLMNSPQDGLQSPKALLTNLVLNALSPLTKTTLDIA